jgi:hypothetical protein
MDDVKRVFSRNTTAQTKIRAEDMAVETLKFRNTELGLIDATTVLCLKDLEESI